MKTLKRYLLLLVIVGLTTSLGPFGPARPAAAQSGTFVDSGQNLNSALSADATLGDLDGDGDLDAFVVNLEGPNQVWVNQGGTQGGTTGVFSGGQKLGTGSAMDVALSDLDGDGDLDAFVVLDSTNDSNQIWINQGGAQGGSEGVFKPNGQTIGDEMSDAVALGDLDGDGDLDAFVSRYYGRASKVWWNDGGVQGGTPGNFSDSGQTLDTDSNDVALGDLDNDGDLDAFSANSAANKVWINQGGKQGGTQGTFKDSGQSLVSTLSLAVSLGDLDGDGDLDAYVANSAADKIWINQGGAQGGTPGVFLDSGQSLSAGQSRDMSLGDLDSDGDLDAFLAKGAGNEVWINQGGAQDGTQGVFLDSEQSLGDSYSEGVALGDVDGDGDLDAFVANLYAFNKVWLNQTDDGQGGPTVSGCFADSSQLLGNSLTWSVDLGDLDGDGDLDAFVANDGANEVWLNNGTGGFGNSGQSLGTNIIGVVALGDLDGDGDLDAFVANKGANKVWLNGEGDDPPDPPATFSDSGQALGAAVSLAVALGDLDGDGDLDAFVANGRIVNGQPVGEANKVWINQGGAQGGTAGVFSDSGQSLGNFFSQGTALGDLDGDGDLDAFVANYEGNKVWINQGGAQGGTTGVFSDSGQSPGNFYSIGTALGDLDGDGDLDAFIANGGLPNEVWLNDGAGSFTDSGQALGNSFSQRVALGDLDGDSDLDAFVVNGRETGGEANTVWLNGEYGLQPGEFLDSMSRFGDSISTAIALGDLDGDGDLDAFVGNWHGSGMPNEVWLNGRCCVLEWLAREQPGGQGQGQSAASHLRSTAGNFLSQATIDLQLFFRVRDELLSQTPDGQRYIDLYYTHDLEIFGLLFADSTLRDEGAAVLELWQPNLQALLNGQGDSAAITAAQVGAVDDFLANLSAAGSPALQEAIADELARLGDPDDFVGMTMDRARGVVVGYAVYLPIVQKP